MEKRDNRLSTDGFTLTGMSAEETLIKLQSKLAQKQERAFVDTSPQHFHPRKMGTFQEKTEATESTNNGFNDPTIHFFAGKHFRGRIWEETTQCNKIFENSAIKLSERLPVWPSPPTTPTTCSLLEEIQKSNVLPKKPYLVFSVDLLAKLSESHPNAKWRESILKNIRDGFWTKIDDLIEKEGTNVVEHPYSKPLNPDDQRLVDAHHEKELQEQEPGNQTSARFTAPIPRAIPGTRYVNQFPRHQRNKARIVNDYSHPRTTKQGERLSVNANTGNAESHLDYTQCLIRAASAMQETLVATGLHRTHKLLIYKFDFKDAYRLIGVHPLVMLKQAIRVKSGTSYDTRLPFGGKISGDIWFQVRVLLDYIIYHVCGIRALYAYVDDYFGIAVVPIDFPENAMAPPLQRLVNLCKYLGFPFGPHKLITGSVVSVLGLEIDLRKWTIRIPDENFQELLAELQKWTAGAASKIRKKPRDFQQLAGWLNWVSTATPTIRPFVQRLYQRAANRQEQDAVPIGKPVQQDLQWILETLKQWNGDTLTIPKPWRLADSDLVQYTDASFSPTNSRAGIGIWWPRERRCFYLEGTCNTVSIAAIELWAIYVGIELYLQQAKHTETPRITAWTDSLSSAIALDNRSGVHFDTLRSMVKLQHATPFDLRVHWTARVHNTVADRLAGGHLQPGDEWLRLPQATLDLLQFKPSSLAEGMSAFTTCQV